MHPSEQETLGPRESDVAGPTPFDPRSDLIFNSAFDFFGTLDGDGRILTLTGRMFDKTNTNTELLRGQLFSETVFWQSSENTARLVDKAVTDAGNGKESTLLVDFRVSADERLPIELKLQPLAGENQIFAYARCLPEKDATEMHEVESEQLLRAAENADEHTSELQSQ